VSTLHFDRSLGVQLVAHTVKVGHGYAAGHLVRRAGRDLGYVWPVGTSWQWRIPTGEHYGERSSLNAALRVLVDIAQLPRTAPPAPDLPPPAPAPRRSTASTRPNVWLLDPPPDPDPAPSPAPSAGRVQWADLDPEALRRAIATRLEKHKR
jgi:hypothetical protein